MESRSSKNKRPRPNGRGLKMLFTSARERAGGGGGLIEDQLVVLGGDRDGLAFVQVALENFLRQRVFEETLNRPAHRTRAVLRVVAFLDEKILRLPVQFEPEVLVPQPL